MKLEHESDKLIREKILQVIGKYVDLGEYKVFFFGSRVSGGGDEHSDIDVGIEGKNALPLRILSDIEEEIEELPILYKIDIVDFSNVSENFRKVAKQHIEYV